MQNFTKITLSLCIGLTLGAGLFTGQAYAGAKPDQVHRLSEDLTPMGSERAGNADGTIPEWTGTLSDRNDTYISQSRYPLHTSIPCSAFCTCHSRTEARGIKRTC